MFERVRDIICDKLGVDADDITMETSFRNDLEVDSLSLFELVSVFEYEFGVEMDDEKSDSIVTVGDAVAYLESIAHD